MTIKIEATRHELEKIKELEKSVDLVLNALGTPSSWRNVMCEVQEMLTEAELCEVEPLIKDEKIRKIVKEWAKVNKIAEVCAVPINVMSIKNTKKTYLYWELESIEWGQSTTICFRGELPDPLEDLGTYTIEELCGSSSDEEGK